MKTEVIAFFAPSWCSSSAKMMPTFKKLSDEMTSKYLTFAMVDVESEEGVDLSTKYEVRNVPIILIVRSGKVMGRIMGRKNKEELKQALEKWK